MSEIEEGELGSLMIPENFEELPKPHKLWFIDEHEQWIEDEGHLIRYANILNDVTTRCKNRDKFNSFQNREVFVLLRATTEEKVEAFKRLDVVLNGTESNWSNQRLDYVNKEAQQCQKLEENSEPVRAENARTESEDDECEYNCHNGRHTPKGDGATTKPCPNCTDEPEEYDEPRPEDEDVESWRLWLNGELPSVKKTPKELEKFTLLCINQISALKQELQDVREERDYWKRCNAEKDKDRTEMRRRIEELELQIFKARHQVNVALLSDNKKDLLKVKRILPNFHDSDEGDGCGE